ncbi:uncharacterized mitochondrial protein AtMg00860-like [Nicotiana tomentosiformis]|uniref:uncharacterized mitochondrial protein AtMg00860-like n=1 Tax=Nicotiana tomentosiformis TaxID=4098 RepID=UPI00388C8CEB
MAFLGHIVLGEGMKVDCQKVEVAKNFPRPTTLTEVRSFLGLVVYYQRFVKTFSSIAAPLAKLTHKTAEFWWADGCEKNFQELKGRLTSASVLTLPEGPKGYVIYCDASRLGLGGILMQHERAVAYSTRQLRKHKQNYLPGASNCYICL